MATARSCKIGRQIGDAVIKASRNRNRSWYGPHMAASVRAISERIQLVNFVLEIRDARVRVLHLNCILKKGKLKHTTVSSQFGDAKDIMSLKIGSHPNVYVLDTPGVFPPKMVDAEICSKLALTGAIPDDIIGETELARVCLTLLNSSLEYKKWAKLCKPQDVTGSLSNESSTSYAQRKRQYPTDHTQDFIVYDVRRVLYETISAFDGNLEDDISMGELIETQFAALRTVLRVTEEASEFGDLKVASKILNLYRTDRIGHYTLEHVSS